MNGTTNTNASTGAICEPDAEFCTFPGHDHKADARQIAWQLVINGVAGGLPIPAAIDIPGHYHIFSVRLPNNDRAGADAWAAYLNLPAPQLEKPLRSGVRNYRSLAWDYPAVPGWKAEVSSFCDEDGAK